MRGRHRKIVHDMYEEFSPVWYETEEDEETTPTTGKERKVQRDGIFSKVWKIVSATGAGKTRNNDNEPDTAVA